MENSSSGAVASVGAAGESATVPQSSETQTTSIGSETSKQVNSPNAPIDEDPEFDLGDGNKLKRSTLQKKLKDLEKGMYKSHEKAASVSKKYDALSQALNKFGVPVEDFLSNPDEHFSKAAQQLISKQVEESLMDPKELEIQRRQEELARREEEIRKFNEAREAEEAESRTSQLVEQISSEWVPVMKESGLPANAKTVARMADVMLGALKENRVKLNPVEAANYTKSLIKQEQNWHLSQMSVEELMAAIPASKKEEVRKYYLNEARPKQPVIEPRQAQRAAPQQSAKPYIGWDEYKNNKRI